MLEYTECSTPRTAVSRNIYTSTDYPADQPIPMHNENSYSDRWPKQPHFYCDTPSATGGATPIADSRSVLGLLSRELLDRFADGVLWRRRSTPNRRPDYRLPNGKLNRRALPAPDRGEASRYVEPECRPLATFASAIQSLVARCILFVSVPVAARTHALIIWQLYIAEGLRLVMRHPILRVLAAATGAANFFSAVFAAVIISSSHEMCTWHPAPSGR